MKYFIRIYWVLCIGLLSSCSGDGGLFGLSPARKLEGTWTTPFQVPLYYYSDVCGTYGRVAKVSMGMRWEISKGPNSNTVNIDIYKTSSSSVQLLVSSGCALYVPLVTPLTLTGEISSSQLTLKKSNGTIVGSFSFTSDNLTGDFNSNFDKFCGIYCSGMGSDSRAITLTK